MKQIFVIVTLALCAITAHAEDAPNDIYSIDGKNFTTKAAAVRYVVALGKPVRVLHTRCEILTNKFSFKACPKNKNGNFENEQFKSISQTE